MKTNNIFKIIGIGALAISVSLIPNSISAQGNGSPTSTAIYNPSTSGLQTSLNPQTSKTQLKNYAGDVPFTEVRDYLKTIFSLQEEDNLVLLKTTTDNLGFTHYRYQQVYNGLNVEGRTVTLHVKEGMIKNVTSNFVKVRNLDTSPRISAAQGLQTALDKVNAKVYAWSNDKNTFAPTGKLVVLHHPVSKKNFLVYKYDVFAYDPISRADIYVDAAKGEIVYEHELIHEANVPASGNSLYNGKVSFTADMVGPNSFRLREDASTLGAIFETYTLNNTYNYGAATDITSTTDTGWTDGAGVQAHWGAEQTYDYFKTAHGRDSYDDLGSPIYSYVHAGVGYVNAFWNGFAMTYGDGDGIGYGPLVALDICGHEIAHGVTQFSANLFYEMESGALNESFSDIFGEMVENHATGSNDWQMGTDIGIGGSGAIRSMNNPNLYGQPDTYLGDYWWDNVGCNPTPYNDFCGVHYNSGVQNKWFYILSEGEAGTNDNSYSYNVPAIGRTKAAAIAYRNLTVYLSSTSNFEDARAGSIQAALDLYDTATANIVDSAWKAVGVYPGVTPAPLPPGPPPANDLCVNATPFSCGSMMIGTTIDATVDSPDSVFYPITAPGVWYKFVASDAYSIIHTCDYETGLSYDTRLSVFSGNCGSLDIIGDNDDAGCGYFGFLSGLGVPTVPGDTYYVLVSGYGNGVGVFGLTVTCTPDPNVLSLVSDSDWKLSTTVTTATSNMYPWPGVASVPAASTFTLPAIVGQPYPWNHVYAVPGSDVIKSASGVTYYRQTFNLSNNIGLSARFRMFVDDNMQIFINGHSVALEEDMGKVNYRTMNHDILFTDNGQVNNGFNGGDMFDSYTNISMDNILQSGANEVVVAIRNRTSKRDKGGFSFRMDLGHMGVVPTVKSSPAGNVASTSGEFDLNLFPNPTNGIVQISTSGKVLSANAEVSVTDLAGRVLIQSVLSSGSEQEGARIDLSAYPSGMYLVKISDGDFSITKSLIKE